MKPYNHPYLLPGYGKALKQQPILTQNRIKTKIFFTGMFDNEFTLTSLSFADTDITLVLVACFSDTVIVYGSVLVNCGLFSFLVTVTVTRALVLVDLGGLPPSVAFTLI